MNARVSVLAATLAIAGMPFGAEAAGLGRITVLSALGQPLRAEIELNASRDELIGMAARVAAPDAFKLAGIDYASTLSALKFSIETRGGQSYVVLSSERPIRDPFVDMLIELNWPAGRLVREYTFLLDPPEMMAKTAPVPAPAPKVVASLPSPPPPPSKTDPARASSGAAPATAAENSVEVKRGDTLHGIATAVKPAGVSLEQMLVGLYRTNPAAFDGNNMNRLRSGAILTVPGEIEVAAVPTAEARRDIRVQVADWNAYKRKLAGAASQMPVAEQTAAQSAQGKITPKVDTPAAPGTESRDQVKVSKTPKDTATAAPEQTIAESKASAEAGTRVAELEKNVADLQRLLELKQKAEAALSVPAKPVEPPPSPAPAAAPVIPPAPTEAPKADAPVPAKPKKSVPPPLPEPEPSLVDGLLGNPGALGGLAGLIALAGGWVAYRRRKSQQGAENPLPLSVNTLSPSSLGANSVFRATGGQSVDTSNVTPATTDFSQAGPGVIDTDEVDPVAEAEVYMAYGRDAQAEEILIEALTKDSKRVSIHLKLLEIYANRKSQKQFETLAGELYTVTGGAGPEWDKAAAMGLKLDAGNPLYSSGPHAVSAAAVVGTAAIATVGAATAASAGLSESFTVSDARSEAPPAAPADFDFDLGIQALSGADATEGGDGYRFDFNFGESKPAVPDATVAAGSAAPDVAESVTVAGAVAAAERDSDAVIAVADVAPEGLPAFDFDLGDSLAGPLDAPMPPSDDGPENGGLAPDAMALDRPVEDIPVESKAEPGHEFALDFPETDTLAMPAEVPPEVEDNEKAPAAVAVASDDFALDFDLGLGDDSPAPAAAAVDISLTDTHVDADLPEPGTAAIPKLDLSGLSLDLEMPAVATNVPSSAAASMAEPAPYDAEATFFEPLDDASTNSLPEGGLPVADSFDLESAPEVLAPVSDGAAPDDDPRWQEVATKLDLAQAYEEMGDAEGARELLDEVIAEGSPAQQASAREMMARLG